MADNAETHGRPPTGASVGELAKQLSEQVSRLAHQEVELAKAEFVVQGKRVETGLGMFGATGAIGFYAPGALVAAAVLGLATAVSAWLSALIIALLLGGVAGLLALQGKSKMRDATPLVAEQITASVQEDVQWARAERKRVGNKRRSAGSGKDPHGDRGDAPSAGRHDRGAGREDRCEGAGHAQDGGLQRLHQQEEGRPAREGEGELSAEPRVGRAACRPQGSRESPRARHD